MLRSCLIGRSRRRQSTCQDRSVAAPSLIASGQDRANCGKGSGVSAAFGSGRAQVTSASSPPVIARAAPRGAGCAPGFPPRAGTNRLGRTRRWRRVISKRSGSALGRKVGYWGAAIQVAHQFPPGDPASVSAGERPVPALPREVQDADRLGHCSVPLPMSALDFDAAQPWHLFAASSDAKSPVCAGTRITATRILGDYVFSSFIGGSE